MSSAPEYASWQNNAHSKWWKDAGLRSMMTSLSVVYAASFTFGVSPSSPNAFRVQSVLMRLQYDGTLLASLIILPQWQAYFDNPTSDAMGLIAASFYFRVSAPSFSDLNMVADPNIQQRLSHRLSPRTAVTDLADALRCSSAPVLPLPVRSLPVLPTLETCSSAVVSFSAGVLACKKRSPHMFYKSLPIRYVGPGASECYVRQS